MVQGLDELPDGLARPIRMAPIPPALRALLASLPRRVWLEVDLSAETAAPLALRQLAKLALLGGPLTLRALRVVEPGAPASLRFSAGDQTFEARAEAIGTDAHAVARRVLAALLRPEELAAVVDGLALETSKLATIQRVVHAMLEASDVRHAVHAMLTGITSGDCLGFHRAMLFVRDIERGVYVGAQAIGPRDDGEAHRIWEEIEVERKSIDAMMADYEQHAVDARLQLFVQTVTLQAGHDPDDEIALAEHARSGVVPFRRQHPVNASMAALGAGEEFVLAAVRPHGEVLGLIFVDDVFGKQPIGPERVRDLEFFVEQAALVWENFTLLERVASLARHDVLTGLLNRRELEARFASEAARATRSGTPCGLVLIDVDRFKDINDTHGHERGDDALRRIAAVLQRTVRGNDTVARFGGDEFVVLLPGAHRDEVAAAARRIGRVVRDAELSVSIGLATWPHDCPEMEQLFSVADANMYRAKRAGRGLACMSGAEPFGFEEAGELDGRAPAR